MIPNGSSAGPMQPAPGARAALALLLAINLFNYIDRYILAAVLPKIAADPEIGPLTKAAQGRLATAFVVSYLVFSPVFGWLGDRMKRWLLVGIGVLLWSLASGGSGLATGYIMLLLTRCLVGIGEAAYGPVAPSVLSDLYPVSRRGKIMAVFYVAIPLGSALGFLLGGLLGGAFGWRFAFYAVVAPGVVLGLLCFLMKEPAIGRSDAAVPSRKAGVKDYRLLFKIPSYVMNTIATTALCFSVGGVAYWMPTYIYEREAFYLWTSEVREKLATGVDRVPEELLTPVDNALRGERAVQKYSTTSELDETLHSKITPSEYHQYRTYRTRILEEARDPDAPSLSGLNTLFGGILALAGLTATMFGGWLGDRLRDRNYPGAYCLVSGWSAILGVPFFLGVLYVPFPAAWVLLFLAIFCLFVYTGPSNTILANVVSPAMRSTGFAVNILVIHILGDAISPWIIGWVADASNLNTGFMVVTGVILIGGAAWLYGARFLAEDTARAPFMLSNKPVPPE